MLGFCPCNTTVCKVSTRIRRSLRFLALPKLSKLLRPFKRIICGAVITPIFAELVVVSRPAQREEEKWLLGLLRGSELHKDLRLRGQVGFQTILCQQPCSDMISLSKYESFGAI